MKTVNGRIKKARRSMNDAIIMSHSTRTSSSELASETPEQRRKIHGVVPFPPSSFARLLSIVPRADSTIVTVKDPTMTNVKKNQATAVKKRLQQRDFREGRGGSPVPPRARWALRDFFKARLAWFRAIAKRFRMMNEGNFWNTRVRASRTIFPSHHSGSELYLGRDNGGTIASVLEQFEWLRCTCTANTQHKETCSPPNKARGHSLAIPRKEL